MTDLNDAFEIDSILIGEGDDLTALIAGVGDPSGVGQAAPLGSFYMRTNGQQYRKTGPGDMDWTETSAGGGGGSGGFTGLGLWRYRTTTDAFPAAGRLQFNNASVDLATELYVNVFNDGSVDMTNFLALTTPGDLIYIQVQSSAAQFVVVQVGQGVLNGSVYTFPLTEVESQGAAATNNETVAFVVSHSGGQVADQLQFFNRAGASENITIVITPTTYLTFFNRAGASENIGII